MSGSGKTVFQVIKILSHGVAMVAEVREGDSSIGKIRETREPRIVLGGVGSLWLVTGEKDEPKLVLEDLEDPPSVSLPMVSALTSTIRASSEFALPANVEAFHSAGQRKITTFATVTRILAAYSARDLTFEEVVVRLREGRLDLPPGEIIAIEVAPGEWLTSQFARLPTGLYGLSPGADPRALFVKTIGNRPESMRLSSGLLVFLSEPRWSLATEKDLRTEQEVLASAERWLGRMKLVMDGRPDGGDLIELLRYHVATTVDPDEKADLSSAARLLADRQPILDVMSQILARDTAFQERLKQFEAAEKEHLKEALRSKLEAEIEAEKARLADIRSEIADAETRLAVAGRREVLLRSETEKHDDAIRARIADAARQLHGNIVAQGDELRREVEELRGMVAQIPVPAAVVAYAPPAEGPPPVEASGDVRASPVEAVEMADESARKSIVAGLSTATGLAQADIVAILLKATDEIPVLVGERAAGTAADIVTALGGDDSAVAFCDPSRISWQDLMRDETSDLAAAVAKAKANPNLLVPIAICSITNGPCEYWIPQFIESRRVGRLPRNLAVVASAGVDGSRVSVPDSILRFLMPVEVPVSAKPVRRLFAGPWPADLDSNRANLADAIDLLSQSEAFESAALQRAAKTLSRVPPETAMADVGKVFVRQAKWLASISADGQYEFKNRFKNIEG